jgi:hypothetical protein
MISLTTTRVDKMLCSINKISILFSSEAVKKYPQNPMLGRRQVTDGKVSAHLNRIANFLSSMDI